MKFLCDVHISYKLKDHLIEHGHEAIHVNHILDKWLTKDEDICTYADEFNLIVISKDADFRNSHLVRRTPRKLVKINLGNLSNSKLIEVFHSQLNLIGQLNKRSRFLIEMDLESSTWMVVE